MFRDELTKETKDGQFGFLVLIVFLLPLAFTFFTYEKFETIKIALLAFLMGCLLVVIAIRLKQIRLNKILLVGTGVFLLTVLLSVLTSVDVVNSITGNFGRFIGLIFYLVLGVFLLLLHSSLTEPRFKLLAKILVLDATLTAIFAVAQTFGFAYVAPPEYINYLPRPPSFTGNADFAAIFIISIFPLALYFLHEARTNSAKIYFYVCGFLSLWGLMVLDSRAATIALAAIIVFGFIVLRKNKIVVLSLFITALLSGLLYFSFDRAIRPYLSSQNTGVVDTGAISRIQVWEAGLKSVISHPLGVGPGNFEVIDQKYKSPARSDLTIYFNDVHNLWLEVTATAGWIPGLLLIAFWLWVFWAAAYSAFKNGNLLSAALGAGLLGFAISASFSPVSSTCWLAFIVLAAGALMNKQTNTFKLRWKPAFMLTGAVLTILAVLFIAAESLTYSGMKMYVHQDPAASYKYFKAANYLDPFSKINKFYLASSAIQAGQPNLKYIKDVADENGGLAERHVSAAQLYADLNDINSAVSEMQKAVSLDKYNPDDFFRLGYYQYRNGDTDGAIQSEENSLRVENNMNAWTMLGKIHDEQGNHNQAFADLEQAYKLSPDLSLKHLLEGYSKKKISSFDLDVELQPLP